MSLQGSAAGTACTKGGGTPAGPACMEDELGPGVRGPGTKALEGTCGNIEAVGDSRESP